MSSSRLVTAVLSLFAIAAAGPAVAAADPVTKTVPGQLVFAHAQNPTDPGNCSAITFIQWADVPNTISATAHYTSFMDAAWAERAETRPAPFDDTYKWVATYTVPAGSHWIQVGKSWRDGPGVDDCSDMAAKAPGGYRGTVTVELTIQESAACVAANKKVAKATATIASLQRRLKSASVRRRASLKLQLAHAKKDLKLAKKTAKKRCP